MSNRDDSSSGGIPPEISELDLASSLVASEEAMGMLGSALAGHVVGALGAQGLDLGAERQSPLILHCTYLDACSRAGCGQSARQFSDPSYDGAGLRCPI